MKIMCRPTCLLDPNVAIRPCMCLYTVCGITNPTIADINRDNIEFYFFYIF